MTNAKLIDSLRNVYGEKADCYHCHSNVGCYGTACMEYLCNQAADALEAAEAEKVRLNTKCADLQSQINSMGSEIEELLPKEG